jgi:FMN phosphatase YigB (HAD superfamily)
MGLAEELPLAEAVKPLMAFRYISFDVVGTMIDFESAIEDELAVIAAEAGQFTKPDYDFGSRIGLANAVDAAS